MEEEYLSIKSGTREAKKKLQVIFKDGRVICYKSATMTYMEVLRTLDTASLQKIDLEIGHLRIISQEIYPKYKDYMKEIRPNWYVNTQSDTEQKYLQLVSISNQLDLGLKVEIGTDFEVDQTKVVQKSKTKENLLVKFPDGNYVCEDSPLQTFISCVEKIGVDAIRRKNIPVSGKELVTITKESSKQQQLSNGQWLTIPNSTKDKAKILKIIGIMLGIKLEATIL